MKSLFLILLSLLLYITSWPQAKLDTALPKIEKPPIDSTAIVNRPSFVGRPSPSNNGKYFMYTTYLRN